MSLTLCGFIFGKPIGFIILKYFNFDIINNKFLGLYIYFEIGALIYILIGVFYIFFKKSNKTIIL